MFKGRLDITATLQVLTPLHVGSGEDRPTELTQGEAPVRVAQVVRDYRGRPCLPGSTVKGILRRQVPVGAETICGSARLGDGQEASGEMGWLLVRMAPQIGDLPDMGHLPERGDHANGIFIEARTRIDRDTGTAQDGLLYHAEMVAPGMCFQLRLALLKPTDQRIIQVQAMLAALTAADGVAFGGGQSNGMGRLRLIDAPRIGDGQTWHLNAPSQPAYVQLKLFCPSPYVAVDASRTSKPLKPTEQETEVAASGKEPDKPAQLQPLKDGAGQPVLRGSALLGVMRARAAWLQARLAGASNHQDVDDPEKDFTTLAQLTPVERLFGVPGFRGCLQVRSVQVQPGFKPVKLTSVALDQFSQAPIDNALFSTQAFSQCRFVVALDLDGRAGQAEKDVLDEVLADASTNGLIVGHGGNKGFGWFEVNYEKS